MLDVVIVHIFTKNHLLRCGNSWLKTVETLFSVRNVLHHCFNKVCVVKGVCDRRHKRPGQSPELVHSHMFV